MGLGLQLRGCTAELLRQRPLCHPRHCGHNSPLQFVLSHEVAAGRRTGTPALG